MLCFCRSEKIEIHFISKSKQLPHAFPGVNTAWTSLAPGESTIAAMNFAEMHIIRSPSRNDIIHWVEWIYKLNCTSVSLCFMGMSTSYFLSFFLNVITWKSQAYRKESVNLTQPSLVNWKKLVSKEFISWPKANYYDFKKLFHKKKSSVLGGHWDNQMLYARVPDQN